MLLGLLLLAGLARAAVVLFGSGAAVTGAIGPRANATALCAGSPLLPGACSSLVAVISYAGDPAAALLEDDGAPVTGPEPESLLVAANWTELWSGSIRNSLRNAGALRGSKFWFSGTNPDGSSSPGYNCVEWTSATATAAAGRFQDTSWKWVTAGNLPCSYASQTLCACRRPPTAAPSLGPSAAPSRSPSATPSASPSAAPSLGPSAAPSSTPTLNVVPTAAPSVNPAASPSPSAAPTASPSSTPTLNVVPTAAPSVIPTAAPAPSLAPISRPGPALAPAPSASPSLAPGPAAPSASPSLAPIMGAAPSASPSLAPIMGAAPSAAPSLAPIMGAAPSAAVASPSLAPTVDAGRRSR